MHKLAWFGRNITGRRSPGSALWTTATVGAAVHSDELQDRVLSAALNHIQEFGWSIEAIRQAASDLHLSPAVAGSFPRAEGHLVEHFNTLCNDKLEQVLEERKSDLYSMGYQDRLVTGLRLRLEMVSPYKETWADAMAVQARFQQLLYTFSSYGRIADLVLRSAGDRSVDFSWYTNRGALIVLYTAGELSMLTDQSSGLEDTWAMLREKCKL